MSGNWKMHHDHIEALHAVRDLGLRMKPADVSDLDVSVHPPFTDIRTVQSLVEGEGIPVVLGAQHCSDQDRGPFTGEVSPQMLARLGVRYVLVGHSERRQLFGMTDAAVALTAQAVLRHSMVPICCVGESAEERSAGRTEARLGSQLRAAIEGLAPEQVAGLVVAYEPIWAIGSGTPATPVDVEDACGFLRSVVAEHAGPDAARTIRIQYGGSVKGEHAADMVSEPDVDGLLVGGASLEASSFLDILRAVAGCYRSGTDPTPRAVAT
ncbi:MAG: triose-phosphate isomerase [Acidimicrobiales bacterium]